MRSSIREMIAGSVDQLRHHPHPSGRSGWLHQWPGQVVLTSAFIEATSDCHEAIKGGTTALKALEKQYLAYQEELQSALMQNSDSPLTKFSTTALLLLDMKTVSLIQDLLRREVESNKDFGWKVKPRSVLRTDDYPRGIPELMDHLFLNSPDAT